ncbi:30S ribosomal protein S21 [candidate division KSB1 bacterium]|nr:30S ribosomal protein S21 [candidate division KSB1 bacterium]NIR68951.1 30S ribosomal protein S21 [candidate division KSB1 bacterium]NIS27288.1 30S ribosomal protein S21 [candidate division KSB1 bacterium]NIT74167.1 30S ribosomal protein S21 [candidate division KSB1 bacterium]NIU28018.1 30S ribosomal protein S21 [candidate division KSB1 bacterium]
MVVTVVKKGESIDKALRRFNHKCQVAGIKKDLKKTSFYLKPSERRKLAKKRAARNNQSS